MGCSSGSNARYFKVLLGLRAPIDARTPCELVNSVIINPQPPRPRMKRRKTVSVTPAMGASTVAGAIFTRPIENESGNVRMPSDDLILPITGEKRNSAAAHPLCKGGKRVKAGQVVLLVLIGMIGGALLIYMAQRLRPAMPADVSAQVRESAPVSVAGAVSLKPSPMPERREAPKPQRFTQKTQDGQAAPVPGQVPVPLATSSPAIDPPPARTEPEDATSAGSPGSTPAPPPRQVTLNAGLLIPVRLVDGLSTERNSPGDAFLATLDGDLAVDGLVIAERGARVEGRVVAPRGISVAAMKTSASRVLRLT